jgi:predicted DNA-binding transcriptional regulator AlpA
MATLPNTLTRLLNERDVATLLGVSLATVRRWRLLGRGPRATKVGTSVRYKPADIEEFLNQCPTIGGPPSGK